MNRPSPYEALAEALADVVRDAVADAIARLADHPTLSDETAFVAVPEAARRLNLGETTTKREIAAGRLRSVLLGRRRLVPVDAIAEFAQALAKDGKQPDQANGEAS
jgi:excisionase family DNA binding protein